MCAGARRYRRGRGTAHRSRGDGERTGAGALARAELSGRRAACDALPGDRPRGRRAALRPATRGAEQGDRPLRRQGLPRACGAGAAGAPGLLVRRGQPRRDRPVPGGRHPRGAHLLRQHDQEARRHRLRVRARSAHVRVRQRGRARKLAAAAPGATVFCRILVDGDGAQWPLSNKFGCDADMAVDLLVLAARAWPRRGRASRSTSARSSATRRAGTPALAGAAAVLRAAARARRGAAAGEPGRRLPGAVRRRGPPIEATAAAIARGAARGISATQQPQLLMRARALHSSATPACCAREVVLVSRKTLRRRPPLGVPRRRALRRAGRDRGRGDPLPDRARAATAGDAGRSSLAGPTCDSVDVLYERNRIRAAAGASSPATRRHPQPPGRTPRPTRPWASTASAPLTTYCIGETVTTSHFRRPRPAAGLRLGVAVPAAAAVAPPRHGLHAS